MNFLKKLVRTGFATVVLLLIVAPFALAQGGGGLPPIATNNPNSPMLVGCSVLAVLLAGALLKALSPDNTSLPWAPPVAVLHVINVACTAVVAVGTSIAGGTPWLVALVGSTSLLIGLTHVGAAKGAKKLAVAAAIAADTVGVPVDPPPSKEPPKAA
jgi:hypothetical protein